MNNYDIFIKKFHPSCEQIKQLDQYAQLIYDYNQVMNLTGIDEYNEVYLKHFYDSLTVCSELDTIDYQEIGDLGSGAGFPGIVLAIMYPQKKIYLIEPLTKRCKFLEIVIDKLGLKNVIILNQRVEDINQFFDVIVSRAVAQLNILLELAIPKVKVGGYFIAMKGSNAKDEIKYAANALTKLNAKIILENDFELPNQGGKRKNILIQKLAPTNEKYPRNFGQIKKKPL